LAGHVYGADHIWDGDDKMPEAFTIQSASQMNYIYKFLFSEGNLYKNLLTARPLLEPNTTPNEDKNMGWAYCMATETKDLLFLYFEKGCQKPILSGVISKSNYELSWFETSTGQWIKTEQLKSDKNGQISLPDFPLGFDISSKDWALKLSLLN
jgi:hypothetical protein